MISKFHRKLFPKRKTTKKIMKDQYWIMK